MEERDTLLEGVGNLPNEVRGLEEQLGGVGGAEQTPVLTGKEFRGGEWVRVTALWFGFQVLPATPRSGCSKTHPM